MGEPMFKAIFSTEEVAVPDAVMPVFDQPTENLGPFIPSASAGPRMMINAMLYTKDCRIPDPFLMMRRDGLLQ